MRRCRDVIETEIGRKLKANEIVHHINGNKSDDRTDNLWICTGNKHGMLHTQAMELINQLMEKGVVEFDRKKGEYILCQNLRNYSSCAL